MKKLYLPFLLLLTSIAAVQFASAQGSVGIGTNTPDASSALDISSTEKGILIPRMTTTERTSIASPANGLMVYDTSLKQFWYYNGTAWVAAIGPKGDTGAKGDKGDTGAQGAKGATGAQGAVGAQGPKGDTGAKGDKGDTGAQGAKGATGAQGAVGAQGPKGDTGAKGDKGDTGAKGATGATGFLQNGTATGQTPYWDGSAWVINSNIYNNGGNVGIGTTSIPGQVLELYRDNADVGIRFHDPNTAWYSMGIDYSDGSKFKINYGGDIGSANHFTMLSNGNIGIGTANPTANLDISSTSSSPMYLRSSAAESDITYEVPTGSWQVGTNASGNGTSGNQFYVYGNGTGYVATFQRGTGNVGIGTSSPSTKLDVNGTATVGYLKVNAQDGVNEGGELQLIGAGSNTTLQIDNYAGNMRIHTLPSGKTFQILGGNGVNITALSGGGKRPVFVDNSGTLTTSQYDQFTKIDPIFIRGTGLNHSGNRILRMGNTEVYNTGGRGLHLTIIKKSDHTIVSSTTYDTYGYTASSDALAAALNGITNDQIGVLTSFDAWEGQITANLQNAFQRLGLFKALNTTVGGSRRPYAAIFEASSSASVPSAQAVEVEYSADANQPYAEIRGWLIDGGFIATGSVPSGLATPIGDNAVNVKENGNVGIGTTNPTYTLHVNGRIKSNGINETSDARLKTNITPIQNALAEVLKMRGVTYDWDRAKHPEMKLEEGKQYGLIAQELEKIIPELVSTDKEGWKSIEYSHLVPVLIEAIKEQQRTIEQLQLKAANQSELHQQDKEALDAARADISRLNGSVRNLEFYIKSAENK